MKCDVNGAWNYTSSHLCHGLNSVTYVSWWEVVFWIVGFGVAIALMLVLFAVLRPMYTDEDEVPEDVR